MKILIVGLGSIGRRHLAILQKFNDIELAALRSGNKKSTEPLNWLEFYSVSDALNYEPDGVLICNPTSFHIEAALPFLKQGAKVLFEKPLSDSSVNLELLKPYSHLIRAAYCLRYLDVYTFLKNEFTNTKPFKISFKRSFLLPLWHPNTDYREEYVARKELGGGVLRTLSHEIDLAVHWFGKPLSVIGTVDRIGFLEIDTDDFAFFSLKMKNNSRINFELDLYSPDNINQGEALTNEGKFTWDINKVTFKGYNAQDEVIVFKSKKQDINAMYDRQMEDFILFVKSGESKACNLHEAIESINIIEKISGKWKG